jgi:hypothetical protein
MGRRFRGNTPRALRELFGPAKARLIPFSDAANIHQKVRRSSEAKIFEKAANFGPQTS